MLSTQSIIDQINTHHQNAIKQAQKAIESAKAAGELLLQVKASLPHGTFTSWIKDNLNVSDRQAQRYMAVAQGKPVPLRKLADKTDTVSVLQNKARSNGKWKNGKWEPEPGCTYLFKEDEGTYWVSPSTLSDSYFHVCKHYHGPRMSTDGFHRRYTIFSTVNDPDLTSKFYVGTTTPLGAFGVDGVLKSYGLKDIEKSLIIGKPAKYRYERPLGEQSPENWYWGNNGEWDDREAYVDSIIKSMAIHFQSN
jgi:hypothetical protein